MRTTRPDMPQCDLDNTARHLTNYDRHFYSLLDDDTDVLKACFDWTLILYVDEVESSNSSMVRAAFSSIARRHSSLTCDPLSIHSTGGDTSAKFPIAFKRDPHSVNTYMHRSHSIYRYYQSITIKGLLVFTSTLIAILHDRFSQHTKHIH